MSETATLEVQVTKPRSMLWLAASLLTLSVVAYSALATYGAIRGLQGRHLWMIGAVMAFGVAPALRLLQPERRLTWLSLSALTLLTVLLFVSGASAGGSFLMWVAGSLTAFGPLLMWVLESDGVEQSTADMPVLRANETALQTDPAIAAAA